MDKEKVQFQFAISREHVEWLRQNLNMTSHGFFFVACYYSYLVFLLCTSAVRDWQLT